MTTPQTPSDYEAAVNAAASAVASAIEKLGKLVEAWDPGRNSPERGLFPRVEAIERLGAVLLSLGPETTVGSVTIRGWDGSSRQLDDPDDDGEEG